MIFESAPWKKELMRHRSLMERHKLCQSERGYFYIERGVMICAFVIRKLIECHKISDSTAGLSVKCKKYISKREWWKTIRGKLGNVDFNLNFEDAHQDINLSILNLCNEFIHSLNFMTVDNEGEIHAFLVCSDRNAGRLIEIDFDTMLEVIRLVEVDEINSSRIEIMPGGKFKFTLSR